MWHLENKILNIDLNLNKMYKTITNKLGFNNSLFLDNYLVSVYLLIYSSFGSIRNDSILSYARLISPWMGFLFGSDLSFLTLILPSGLGFNLALSKPLTFVIDLKKGVGPQLQGSTIAGVRYCRCPLLQRAAIAGVHYCRGPLL